MIDGELSHDIAHGTLYVRFGSGDAVERIGLECVLDVAGDGEIVGVEVLDFRRQARGADVPRVPPSNAGHASYDVEMDALYLRVGAGHAPYQKKTSGVVVVDARRHVMGLEIAL